MLSHYDKDFIVFGQGDPFPWYCMTGTEKISLGGAYLGQRFSFSILYYAITPSDKLFTVVSLTYLDADEN